MSSPEQKNAASVLPPEVSLLRQDNLMLTVRVIQTAFTGENLIEIPKSEMLRAIRQAIKAEELREGRTGIYTGAPEEYLYRWTNSAVGTPWFGSQKDQSGETIVTLLPEGRRVVEFLYLCGNTDVFSSSTETVMDRLFDTIVMGASRLSGDNEARRRNLQAQIDRLTQQLNEEPEKAEVSPEEYQTIIKDIGAISSEMRSTLSTLADQMQETNRREFQRSLNDNSAEALREFRSHVEKHRASPAFRSLQRMRDIFADSERRSEVTMAIHVLTDSQAEETGPRMPPLRYLMDSLNRTIAKIHENDRRAVEIQNSIIDMGALSSKRLIMNSVSRALDLYRDIVERFEPGMRDPDFTSGCVDVPGRMRLDKHSVVQLSTTPPEEVVERAPAPLRLPSEGDDGEIEGLKATLRKNAHMEARKASIKEAEFEMGQRLSDIMAALPVRYGIEEVVRSLDVCIREKSCHFSADHFFAVALEIGGEMKEVIAPDPLILEGNEETVEHGDIHAAFDKTLTIAALQSDDVCDGDLRKINLKNEEAQ